MKIGMFYCSLWLLTSCASRLVVTSEPADAKVYVRTPGTTEKVDLGQTPMEMKTTQLQEKSRLQNNSGEYRELIVEKEGFKSQILFLPVARFANIETKVFAKLEPLPPTQPEVAEQLVQHLFNAQQFAQTSAFDRAQVELDAALKIYPKFTRALSMRGTLYYLQKNYVESLKWYEKALEVDPQYQDAVKMITRLNELLKKEVKQ